MALGHCFLLSLVGIFSSASASPPSPIRPSFGAITGLIRDQSGNSIAGVTVSAAYLDGSRFQATISTSAGTYTFADLTPGEYVVTVQLPDADRAGTVSRVRVNAGAASRQDLAIPLRSAVSTSAQPQGRISAEQPRSGSVTLARWIKGDTITLRDIASPDPVAIAPAPSGSPLPAAAAIPSAAISDATPPPATPQKIDPFSDADWTWLNGNPRNKEPAFDSKFFTPDIRADLTYSYDSNHPSDHSMGGSSELFRSNEIQLEQLGIGGDFHWDNVRARFMTQFGLYSTATPRNDPSTAKGQWDLANANRYISEAYGGYHLNVLNGINIDAGIFMSYIGLFSYYNYDNWAYQPSYVSSNTPWFFQGVRAQIFPTPHLKIEPYVINGWQSYGSSNHRKGLGGQIRWSPRPWLNIISNDYGLGRDDLYIPGRSRIHTDNSIEVKYFDKPSRTLDKMAFTVTGDLGCEYGAGVSCHGNTAAGPKQSFIGYMFYNRMWFHKDLFAFTLGGGQINNPGRYLVLLPPINGRARRQRLSTRRTSRKILAILSKRTTCRGRSIICRSNGSRFALKATSAMRMFLISAVRTG